MNSIKNAIVTMTLLAVGYGAYVVMNNPAPETLDEMAADAWAAPEVSLGDDPMGIDVSLPPGEGLNAPADLPPAGAPPDGSGQMANGAVGSFAPPPAVAQDAGAPGDEMHPVDDAELPRANLELDQDGNVSLEPPVPETMDDAPTGDNYYLADGAYPNTGAAPLPSSDSSATSGPSAAAGNSGFEATWQSIQADLQAGQPGNALLAASAWYGEPSLTAEQQQRCLDLLDQLAGTVIYSRDSILEPAHVVRAGETLADLAAEYQVPASFLARINGIDSPYDLYPGESLKVVRGPFRAEVHPQSGDLTLYLGQYYAGRFPVRCGPALPADSAEFEVAAVEPGRTYFDARSGYRVETNHPQNPYGPYWIGLRGDQITAAHNVGIHVDRGDSDQMCIAVSEQDADDLSAILSVGSRITISLSR